MARQPRIEYPGALYHVLSRGDPRKVIFRDNRDREDFLDVLQRACAKTEWQVHAYCLLEDHFHLVVETPQANLSTGMQWFLGLYTNRFQRRHKSTKRVFRGRFKSVIIDASVKGHLRLACDYVHLNPVRAKLITPRQPLQAYRWSSYAGYLKPPTQRSEFLHVEWLLAEMGMARDNEAGRRQFALQMEQRRREATSEEWGPLRRGWYLGDKEFRQLLLDQGDAKRGPRRSGREPVDPAAEKKARRILREEMAKRGWTQADLTRRRKGDPEKIRIAYRIRSETTVTTPWLAKHLKLGTMSYAISRLYRFRAKQAKGR